MTPAEFQEYQQLKGIRAIDATLDQLMRHHQLYLKARGLEHQERGPWTIPECPDPLWEIAQGTHTPATDDF